MKQKNLLWKKLGVGVLAIISILGVITLSPHSVEAESEDEIQLNFTFDEPEITEISISDTTYHFVTMNETQCMGATNVPYLPVKPLKILLPQKGILESINVTYNGNTSVGNNYNVMLGSNQVITNFSHINESNELNFNTSKPFPLELFSSPSIYFFRGYKILVFNLYPVHYINDSGKIYYYQNMTVTIKTNNTGSVSPYIRGLQSDESMMKQKVDDYSMNTTYTSIPDPPANSSIVDASKNYKYMIITTKSLWNAPPPDKWDRKWYTFKDFAKSKKENGTNTIIFNVSDIVADESYSVNGTWGDNNPDNPFFISNITPRDCPIFDDTQARIRNCIRDMYYNCGVEYVLLGGDDDTVPARKLYKSIPSDIYYACLDSSYNGDDDKKIWGDKDDGDHNPGEDEVEPGGGGTFYATADSHNSKGVSFEVGLFTPSLDFSDLPEQDNVTVFFKKNFKAANLGDYINVSVYSGGKVESNYEEYLINDTQIGDNSTYGSTFVSTFNPYNYTNSSNVYIRFFYCYTHNGQEEAGSFNIDDVNITIPGEVDWEQVLWESFEGWSFPPDGWKTKKYGTTEGNWTQKAYEDDLDMIAEVYVGRVCPDEPREVSNFVNKTLAYNSTPANRDYIGRALFAGINISIVHKPGTPHRAHPKEYKEEIRNYSDKHGYQTYGIPDIESGGNYTIDTLYDADWQHNKSKRLIRRIFGWPPKELKKRIKEGRSIINIMGHGGYRRIGRPWSTKDYYNNDNNIDPEIWLNVLGWSKAYLLTNDRYFFMYAFACKAGRFIDPGKNKWGFEKIPDDCLAEFLTVKTNHGAFAVIMYTYDGYPGYELTECAGQRHEREFFDAIYREDIHELGKALQDSKEDNLNWIKEEEIQEFAKNNGRKTYYGLNLFGDPQTPIIMPVKDSAPATPGTPQKSSSFFNWYTFKTSTTDSDNDQVSYKWRWDDNECTHWTKYKNSGDTVYWTKRLPAGNHTISVKARDISCLSETNWSVNKTITISFNSDIVIETSPAVLGDKIQFYGKALGGANEPVSSWNYDFGDENYSNSQNTEHTYGDVGSYNVTMTVTDNKNITSNVTKVVKVVILKADINSSSDHGIPEETITFNDTSNGYHNITSWYWDFGDGNNSSNRNTSHAYAAEGVYNVSLNVTDIENNYNITIQTIYVDNTDPDITSVSSDLADVGYGYNITIIANLSDNVSGIKTAAVNITYPDDSHGNFTMSNIQGSIYEHVFNDTSQLGGYNYTIWVVDYAENLECSTQSSFIVLRSFGNRLVGISNQSIWHTITGSKFKVNLKGVADNVSVYIDPGNATSDSHYQCVIYRHNDSKLMGISEEKNVSSGKGWKLFNFSTPKPVLMNDTEYVLACWSDNYTVMMYYVNGTGNETFYNDGTSTLQGHYFEGFYNYTPSTNNFGHENRRYSIYCRYTPDDTPPQIANISDTPDTVGFGFNVTIHVNATDEASGIKVVKINVSYPDDTYKNFTINNTENDTYKFVFYSNLLTDYNTDTWLVGQYNYTIWIVDYAGNGNSSSGHSFNVSAQATLTVATLKDSYGTNEYINITDPPLPSNDYYIVGRGITWNEYYDATSGRNVLELYPSPVNYQDESGNWNPIECNISLIDGNHPAYGYGYRTGNEHGLYSVYFKPIAQNNWPIAFAYNKSTEPDTHVVRSKLVGVGYLDPSQNWSYKYLQSVQSSQGQINGNTATYEDVFTGTDVIWTYGNTGLKEEIIMDNATKTLLQNHPPSQYGLSNQNSYLVFITKLDYQNLHLYNSSGILTGNFTTVEGIDFKNALGQFTCALPIGDAYELNDESVRQRLTYRILQYNGNYYLLSGLRVIDLNDMTFPVVIDPTLTVTSSSYDGDITGDGGPYSTVQGASEGSPIDNAATFSIGQRCESMGPPPPPPIYFIYRGCVYFDTSSIPSTDLIDSVTLKLYKDSDFSTTDFDIIVQNGQPTYPHAPMVPGDYDEDHYSGNGGSLNTASFSNGYNDITITNHSWINTSGTTKLCLRSSRDINSVEPSGDEYVTVSSSGTNNEEPKLLVVYRNQSKIKNTGSTDIKGYLLMKVQYYNVSTGWASEIVAINDTTPRVINSSEQLALDLIFNGLVNTNNLTQGSGTYRIYAAFRDPDGNILKCDDETELVATYQFTVTFT
jgi:hypothetical protein